MTAILQALAVHYVIDADVFGGFRVVSGAGIADVELLVIRRKAQSVWLEQFVGDLVHLAGLAVDAVDSFFHFERHYASAFVDSGDAVTGIGEPDTAIGMHDDVVRRVETFALELVGYYSHRAVVLIAGYAPRAMLAGELAAFVVESVAVAVVRCLAIFADVAILLEPAHLPVVGDVA